MSATYHALKQALAEAPRRGECLINSTPSERYQRGSLFEGHDAPVSPGPRSIESRLDLAEVSEAGLPKQRNGTQTGWNSASFYDGKPRETWCLDGEVPSIGSALKWRRLTSSSEPATMSLSIRRLPQRLRVAACGGSTQNSLKRPQNHSCAHVCRRGAFAVARRSRRGR